MASGLNLLRAYDSSDSGEEDDNKSLKLNEPEIKINPELSIASSIIIDSAPLVLYSVIYLQILIIFKY
jgi:hypothetical protein